MTDALSSSALARLKRIESAARSKTKGMGIAVEFVSAEAIWMLYGGKCCCDLVRYPGCGRLPIDLEAPAGHNDAPCLAHVDARRRRLKGTHSPENCRWWRTECNREMAKTEASSEARGIRMAVNWSKKGQPKETQERPLLKSANRLRGRGAKIQSRGFPKNLRKRMNGIVERVER